MTSSVSYYELNLVGEDDKVILDLGRYGGGHESGRNVPAEMTITLESFRFRSGAFGSAATNPRLLVSARGASSGFSGVVSSGVAGGFGSGAGVAVFNLLSRTSDSTTQATDSSSAGQSVVIPLRGTGRGYADAEVPMVVFQFISGGVSKELINPPATTLASSSSTYRILAENALCRGKGTSASLDGLEVYVDIPFDDSGYGMNGAFGLPSMYLFGTAVDGTGFPGVGGGKGVIAFHGDATCSWVAEAHGFRGSAFALFYSTDGDTVQRIDYIVGDVITPRPVDANLPLLLRGDIADVSLTFRDVLALPRLDPIGTPAGGASDPFASIGYPSTRRSILVPLTLSPSILSATVSINYG